MSVGQSPPPARAARRGIGSPRIFGAVVAGVLAVLFLSNGAGSWAQWSDTATVPLATISSGSLGLNQVGQPALHLLSRQPVGSRSYESPTTCPVPSGAVECRIVTSTLSTERLVPGDTVRIFQSAALTAEGRNLRGVFSVDATGLVTTATSPLSAAASVSMVIVAPSGSRTAVPSALGEVPVSVADASTLGTYTVEIEVTIPASDGQSRWGTALRSQLLDLTSVSFAFTQTP